MTNTTKTTKSVIKNTNGYLLEVDLYGIKLEVIKTAQQVITVETTCAEKDLEYLRVIFTDKGASVKYKNPSATNNMNISNITTNGKKVNLKEFGAEETNLTRMKITIPQGINIELTTDSDTILNSALTFTDSDITLEALAKLKTTWKN